MSDKAREIKFQAWSKEGKGKYELGTDGKVFSNDYNHTGKRKEMRQYLDEDGYAYVFLTVGGKRYKRYIHRMMAELFLVKPSEKHQVNHKNGIRNDNELGNIEWVTPQENVLHSYRVNGRKHSIRQRNLASERMRGEGNPKAKLDLEKAERLRELREQGVMLKDLSKMFGISTAQASAVARGVFWNEQVGI